MLRSHAHRTRSSRRIHVRLLALPIIALLAVVACASSATSGVSTGGERQVAPGAGGAAPTAAPRAPGDALAAPDGSGKDVTTVQADGQSGPLIVRTGSLQLEVKDLDVTLLQARGRIVGLGGYVSDSERVNAGDGSTALITYRIPAARWDEAMDALRGFGTKILGEQTKAVEITGQVLDLGARIDNLRATERALQAIMAQATKISDILDVQNQLSTVQGQIEQLSTQKAHLSDQAALGTLAVTYSLPFVAVAQASSGWNLAAEFDRAVAQLVQVGQGLAVLVVWLAVVVLPLLVGMLLLALAAVFIGRRFGLIRRTGAPAMPTGGA